jgi:hypothetical protein
MQIKALTTFTLAVAARALAENATYIGCYYDCQTAAAGPCGDATTSNRDLPAFFCVNGKDPDAISDCAADPFAPVNWAGSRVMTPEFCSGLCMGFKFFGVQTIGCFCGNDYGNQGGKIAERFCNTPCNGDTSIMCGGPYLNSIYAQPPSMY